MVIFNSDYKGTFKGVWFSDECQIDISETIRGREYGLVAPCVCPPQSDSSLPFICQCDARHKPRNQKSKNSLRIMIWAAINSNHKAIWFVVPKVDGKKGLDAEEYIKLMRRFRSALEERGIDSTKITYQQGKRRLCHLFHHFVTILSPFCQYCHQHHCSLFSSHFSIFNNDIMQTGSE